MMPGLPSGGPKFIFSPHSFIIYTIRRLNEFGGFGDSEFQVYTLFYKLQENKFSFGYIIYMVCGHSIIFSEQSVELWINDY